KIYAGLVHDLDSGGARYSAALSEVDLGDPEDVKVTVPNEDGAVLVHLGDTSFQERFRTYESHVQLWRQQYHRLESVDLRFDRQVIVHPVIASAPEPGPHGSQPDSAIPHNSTPVWKRKPSSRGHGQPLARHTDGH
ncbi:MAG: hypothetical protein JO041_07580, partial [Acidobacteria bacterium]|nr:hypothetical protein [Acidobacteriota bacterium]